MKALTARAAKARLNRILGSLGQIDALCPVELNEVKEHVKDAMRLVGLAMDAANYAARRAAGKAE